ncbi:MAG: AAA family ATPase [Sulfitobacter sp.]
MSFRPIEFDSVDQNRASLSDVRKPVSPKNFNNVFIPEAFRRRILSHVVKNSINKFEPALFLGVQGPPGEGKSFQIRATLSQSAVSTFSLSASELSGQHERDAIEPISRAYLDASEHNRRTGEYVAIVIDDFDLSISSTFKSSEYTVNSQLLTGFLMNLADDPLACGGVLTVRVPVFFTGNNFTSLYKPLIRHGRFELFDWEPDLSTKIDIVGRILRQFVPGASSQQIEQLVVRYQIQPISFFASLRADIVELAITRAFDRRKNADLSEIRGELLNGVSAIDFATLSILAKDRSQRQTNDYIAGK